MKANSPQPMSTLFIHRQTPYWKRIQDREALFSSLKIQIIGYIPQTFGNSKKEAKIAKKFMSVDR